MAPESEAEVRLELIPFQDGPRGFVQFGTSPWLDYFYLLAHGGRGSGKSKGGAIRGVTYAVSWPGSLGIVTAPTYNLLHDSTVPVLFETLEQFGLVPEIGYTYNRTREEVVLPGFRSKILLRTTEKPERLRGMNAAWFWMDEPRDSPLLAFQNLQATLRQQGYPHQGWCTTTPVGKRHWTYGVFYREKASMEGYLDHLNITADAGSARYVAYPARTRENPFGGQQLYDQLAATYGPDSLFSKQELEGDFVLMEGLVYSGWNPAKHVKPRSEWPSQPSQISRIIAGVDFGFRNPSAIVVEGLDKANRRYLIHEFYQSGLSESELVMEAAKIGQRFKVQLFICDSADPGWIKALRRGGLPARAVKKKTIGSPNNPSSGIAMCSLALRREDPVYGQMFYVDPGCENFRREIESYVWDEARLDLNPREVPRKFGDHLMDAWRYAETTIGRIWDPEAERMLKAEGIVLPSTGRLIKTEIN